MVEMILLSCLLGSGLFVVALYIEKWYLRHSQKVCSDVKKQRKRMLISDIIISCGYLLILVIEIIMFFITGEAHYIILATLTIGILIPTFFSFKKYKKKGGLPQEEIVPDVDKTGRGFFLLDLIETIGDFIWELFD